MQSKTWCTTFVSASILGHWDDNCTKNIYELMSQKLFPFPIKSPQNLMVLRCCIRIWLFFFTSETFLRDTGTFFETPDLEVNCELLRYLSHRHRFNRWRDEGRHQIWTFIAFLENTICILILLNLNELFFYWTWMSCFLFVNF